MALEKTLTSANSKFTLVVAGLALGPYTLEGYSTDSSFAADPVVRSEPVMGVDGRMSAGWIPNPTDITIMLQADSPSIEFFDSWDSLQQAVKETAFASGSIAIPSVGKSYVLTKGVLVSVTPMASGGKQLGPQAYKLTFESVTPVPLVL